MHSGSAYSPPGPPAKSNQLFHPGDPPSWLLTLQFAPLLPYLPPFTQTLLVQINANYDSSFTGLQDAKGYPTNDAVLTLAPLMGMVTCDLQIKTYCVVKFLLDNCRRVLGLPVAPTLTQF